ncbi:uncharacterized protein LOC117561399 isoform X2 [Gymnodraco acuticeps]|nr:uncharacterized protein LOC117532430 isoform X2 [Gymnodraco acuticeps]XP_034058201.1 uncharacterized protein LOC117537169 isoform X2 [Gymnodraco acuticeps]XP_034061023.1 uncharacterized protein LOC117539101 isoform X2 [Gymnodraco acuticeps]XP_034074878.1 uncharacterized protein LOC117548050 isoform X2 [Gymnodraco acuticeps]XP_034075356.1 uncharacterized protein LOC117548296 isoform X2 [Gymnodraco acuticeps]XP_034078433.1 uncharacterized protein LOC117550184 isoform X2 [Gymnodraco acuticeps]
MPAEPDLDDLIKLYFRLSLSNKEILAILAHTNHIVISVRTLKRICKRLNLFRRKNQSDLEEVLAFVQHEIMTNGQMQGYRWLHLRAIQQGLVVSQDSIRRIIKLVDPQGVELRRAHRLRRRQYRCRGPNALWHMDGYDKLKPYGIAINGCIDGFSRYVLWMEAYITNSDPKVVASYFIKTVSGIGGCPERIRADRGTENVSVEEMQMFLRRNHPDSFAGERSFLYGRSTANQRIEGWWGILRKQSAQFWMNLFQTLQEDGHFTGDFLDKSLIQFCYLNLVQDELDEVVNTWNSHKIRPRSTDDTASGRPVIMYSFPELHSAEDRLKPIAMEEVNLCMLECTPKGQFPCDETVFELCCLLMAENGWDDPADPFAAADLYILLRDEIRRQVFD